MTDDKTTDDKTMTIREMCDAYDVTARTLRFYEAKELLHPIRQGQKRLFTRHDRGRLKLILRGKQFGFSLEDIRQLLDLYSLDDQALAQKVATYEMAMKRLAELEDQRDQLTETIEQLKWWLTEGASMIAAQQKARPAKE